MRAVAWIGLLPLLAACGGDPTSPEERVAAVVARFEQASAERDLGAAVELVSDAYADPAGYDKAAIKGLLARYFLGHEAIHVLSRIRSLEIGDPPTTARMEVVAALTGAPVAEPGELGSLSGDLYRFDLELALEDDDTWRVTRADWRPAQPAEFLP